MIQLIFGVSLLCLSFVLAFFAGISAPNNFYTLDAVFNALIAVCLFSGLKLTMPRIKTRKELLAILLTFLGVFLIYNSPSNGIMWGVVIEIVALFLIVKRKLCSIQRRGEFKAREDFAEKQF